jgi:hypothetical protein
MDSHKRGSHEIQSPGKCAKKKANTSVSASSLKEIFAKDIRDGRQGQEARFSGGLTGVST